MSSLHVVNYDKTQTAYKSINCLYIISFCRSNTILLITIYSGTPLNRNLSKPKFSKPDKCLGPEFKLLFLLYKYPGNRNPSIPETGQAFYYF